MGCVEGRILKIVDIPAKASRLSTVVRPLTGGEPRFDGGRYRQGSSVLTMPSLGRPRSLYGARAATQPRAWSVEALTAGLAGVVSLRLCG
jgi:hypothetical protein